MFCNALAFLHHQAEGRELCCACEGHWSIYTYNCFWFQIPGYQWWSAMALTSGPLCLSSGWTCPHPLPPGIWKVSRTSVRRYSSSLRTLLLVRRRWCSTVLWVDPGLLLISVVVGILAVYIISRSWNRVLLTFSFSRCSEGIQLWASVRCVFLIIFSLPSFPDILFTVVCFACLPSSSNLASSVNLMWLGHEN